MTSRRSFVKACASATISAKPFSLLLANQAKTAWAQDQAATGQSVSQADQAGAWMDKAFAAANAEIAAKGLNGPLLFGRFVERIFFLLQPIEWDPDPGQEAYKRVIVPTGFVTDLASIPRGLYSLLPPDGPYTYPAVIHDFLYWNQGGTKVDADHILDFGMQDLKIGAATRRAIYDGVHLGGQPSWDGNTKLKAGGEKRILKRFPQDPTTRWIDWKNNPANFA